MARIGAVDDKTLVTTILENYLDHIKATRSAGTYRVYSQWINNFYEYLGIEFPALKIVDLKPLHVTKYRAWLTKNDPNRFSDNSLHSILRTVKGAFNWACKQGLIPNNPIALIEMPRKTPREILVSDEQWEKVMKHVKDDEFRELLIFFKATGCRPFEAITVQARHFDRDERRFVLERSESKGKKYNRVIYLNDEAFAISCRLALKYPEGPIFRNAKGDPWNKNSLNCRLRRLTKHTGFKLMLYALRHTFATNALINDVDAVSVAQLMGHRDLTMVARTYGHLAGASKFLRDKLAQATGGKKPKTAVAKAQ
jgi:integrase